MKNEAHLQVIVTLLGHKVVLLQLVIFFRGRHIFFASLFYSS